MEIIDIGEYIVMLISEHDMIYIYIYISSMAGLCKNKKKQTVVLRCNMM